MTEVDSGLRSIAFCPLRLTFYKEELNVNFISSWKTFGNKSPEYRLLLRISVPCKSRDLTSPPTFPALRVSITVTRFVGGSLRTVY